MNSVQIPMLSRTLGIKLNNRVSECSLLFLLVMILKDTVNRLLHLDSKREMQSTQKVSPEYVYNTTKVDPIEEESADPCSTIRINYQKGKNQFESMSAMTMTYNGAPVTDSFFKTSSDPGKSIDKLAIDYTPIPQHLSSSICKFSQEFFQSHNRRRHAIRVFYQ